MLARTAGLGVAVCAIGAAACGGKDPYAPTAYLPTIGTTFVMYPLSTVVAPQNSAIELRTPTEVRPAVYLSSTLGELVPNFDVAFDVDSTGQIVLLPPKLVVSPTYSPRTGFQISSTLFDSLKAAPGGTYQADSAFRVKVGQTIVAQVQGTGCTVASPFYVKMVIDSVNATTRAMYLSARVDPNCSFKSFAAGVPSS
ncbi:hypothetical protein tb265_27700 [Gemmatimonadetes bacterium T265]|nr:hypothetical protein tb265_27700 [Gemmatimonadetes bacterium T265]